MYCPRCSSALGDPSMNTCDNCGYDLASNLVCKKCRERIEPGWVICPGCGEPIDDTKSGRQEVSIPLVSEDLPEKRNVAEERDEPISLHSKGAWGGEKIKKDIASEKTAQAEQPVHYEQQRLASGDKNVEESLGATVATQAAEVRKSGQRTSATHRLTTKIALMLGGLAAIAAGYFLFIQPQDVKIPVKQAPQSAPPQSVKIPATPVPQPVPPRPVPPSPQPSTFLAENYTREYEALFEKVKSAVSKEKFDRMMSRKEAYELDTTYMEKLRFIASPQSVEKQEQMHKDWIPILVNEKTTRAGAEFYRANKAYFDKAFNSFKVKPADIVSILNWESRLGEKKGEFLVFKVFVGQYFFLEKVETDLFIEGAYNKPGVMQRPDALKRIERLRKQAFTNLAELIIQSEKKGTDPLLVKGSWGGAIGIPQFMPASMVYAKDGDGDGKIDLNSIPDAIMSIASYLEQNNYHKKGREYAIKCYNRSEMYLQGIVLYSSKISEMGVP